MSNLTIVVESSQITKAADAIRKEMGPEDDPDLPSLGTLELAVSLWLEECVQDLLQDATWHTDSPNSTMTTEWRNALRRAETKAKVAA